LYVSAGIREHILIGLKSLKNLRWLDKHWPQYIEERISSTGESDTDEDDISVTHVKINNRRSHSE
jgi:hypothetical protein